ncbi:hypothetical protein FBU59_005999, partial [Linderina macrospora]
MASTNSSAARLTIASLSPISPRKWAASSSLRSTTTRTVSMPAASTMLTSACALDARMYSSGSPRALTTSCSNPALPRTDATLIHSMVSAA